MDNNTETPKNKSTSSTHTFTRTSIKAIVVNVGIIIVLCGIFLAFVKPATTALLCGLALYFFLSTAAKLYFLRYQRSGMKLVRMKQYAEAQKEFEASLQYFTDNNWIDKYRSVLMFDTSDISYTEMSINNIAYCLCCLGDIEQAKEYYKKLEHANPKSELAKIGFENIEKLKSRPGYIESVIEHPKDEPAIEKNPTSKSKYDF